MIFFLGIMDLLAAAALMSRVYSADISQTIILGLGLYLLIKGAIFIIDIGSLFDVIGGILLIASLYYQIPNIFLLGVGALIAFKGIVSLIPTRF